MGKDKQEEICYCNLLNSTKTKYIRKTELFREARRITGWEESPDFLAQTENDTLAIEHFAVDQVYVSDFHRSSGRLVEENATNVYECHHKGVVDDTFDAYKAVKDVQDLFAEASEITTRFNYTDYIQQFDRIFRKHTEKIDRYKGNLQESGYKNVRLFFLIEQRSIVISDRNFIQCYAIRDDGAEKKVKGNKVIITHDLLDILKTQIGILEGVIIQVYTLLDLGNSMRDMVYFDLSTKEDFEKSIIEQKLEVFHGYNIRSIDVRPIISIKD